MAQADFYSIREGDNTISFNGKILSGSYKKKKMFFFSNIQEFSFPVRQISSIRFFSEKSLNMKGIIFGGLLVLIGLATLQIYVGIVLLIIGGYLLFQNFKPINGIKIFTSGGDNEFFIIEKTTNKGKAKELVDLVNEKISEIK